MKSLLEEIRQQPRHIREIFMWVMVVITFSVVGFAWFRSTTQQLARLVNPELAERRALAQSQRGETESPFATIGSAWSDLKASIFELLDLTGINDFEVNRRAALPAEPVPPQALPLSEDK